MLNVVLRTCDHTSLTDSRIVPKDECIKRCYNSLTKSIQVSQHPTKIYIIDDGSRIETTAFLSNHYKNATLAQTAQISEGNNKQKSRYSLKLALDYISTLPDDELVYLVEDDYLHYENSIKVMLEALEYFQSISDPIQIGIFPQDFNQLYFHPNNPFNDTYVGACMVLPGPDRYYRTTWFTHESFLIPVSLFKKFKAEFYSLLEIGTKDGAWEGNTISNVWQNEKVRMLMPLQTLAIHLGQLKDISFYTDWEVLWQQNEV